MYNQIEKCTTSIILQLYNVIRELIHYLDNAGNTFCRTFYFSLLFSKVYF